MNLTRLLTLTMLIVILLSLSPAVLTAQEASSCPALVEQALVQLQNNCANMERNTACYGFPTVQASFSEGVPLDSFVQPAQRSALSVLTSLATGPLDLTAPEWGLAVITAQADIPDSLPGQNVTFLLMGDATLESAELPDSSTTQAVVTLFDTNLFSAPSPEASIIASVPPSTELQANAISQDGLRVRVTFNGRQAWLATESLAQSETFAQLPTARGIGAPMQAFYFTTGLGAPGCAQAPSTIAIRSPENLKINLNANGASIQLGSLITLRILPDGETMELATHEGEAELEGVNVPAGSFSTRCLESAENLGVDGLPDDQTVGTCTWTAPQPQNEEQQQLGQFAIAGMNTVTEDPNQPTPEPPGQCNTFYTVAAGDNLFRLGLRFGTNAASIRASNQLTSDAIFTGQQLFIPCGILVNDLPPDPNLITPVGGVDCSTFRPTSPLEAAAYTNNAFFWDGAAGATRYVVNVFNSSGSVLNSFNVSAPATSVTGDIAGAGSDFSLSWEVLAYAGDQLVCTSRRINLVRSSTPPTPVVTPLPATVTTCVSSPTICPANCTSVSAPPTSACSPYWECTCPVP